MKTSQFFAKRFKITKRKKILHRICGQDHYRSKKSGKIILKKKKEKEISSAYRKIIKSLIRNI